MRSRLMAVLLSSAVVLGSVSPSLAAIGPDGCDEEIFAAMENRASSAINANTVMMNDLFYVPQPAASSSCMSAMMNVFDIRALTGGGGLGDALLSAASGSLRSIATSALSAIPGMSSLLSGFSSLFGGSSLPGNGLTLIEPSLIKQAQSFVKNNTDRLVCPDSFAGYGQAFRAVKFSGGQVTLGNTGSFSGGTSGALRNVFNRMPSGSVSFSLPTFTQ